MAYLRRPPYTKPIPPDAEIVTVKGKPHARFRGDGGRTVTAPLIKKGDRIRLRSAKWHGVYRDADGKPAGVRYERLALALLPLVQEHATRAAGVEERLSAIEAGIAALVA